jgi:hypothetical protein
VFGLVTKRQEDFVEVEDKIEDESARKDRLIVNEAKSDHNDATNYI